MIPPVEDRIFNHSILKVFILVLTLAACGVPPSQTQNPPPTNTKLSTNVTKTSTEPEIEVEKPISAPILPEIVEKETNLEIKAKEPPQKKVSQKNIRKFIPSPNDIATAKRLNQITLPLPDELLGFWDGHGAKFEDHKIIPNVLADKSLVLRRSKTDKGRIPINNQGLIQPSLDPEFDGLELDLSNIAITELSMGGFAEITKDVTGVNKFAHLMGVAPNEDRTVNNRNGQVGIYGAPQNFRFYNNPDLTKSRSRSTATLDNQGLVHLAITLQSGKLTGYINGIPAFEGPAKKFTPFNIGKITLLGASYSFRVAADKNQHREYADMFWLSDKALSNSEVLQIDAHARERFSVKQVYNLPRKIAVIGCCDSLTAFLPSPFWRLNESPRLKPGFIGVLDAIGGSKFGSKAANAYDNEDRRRLRINMAVSALSAGYQNVVMSWQYGTNDLLGVIRSRQNPIGWRSGRTIIDDMIQEDKARILSHPNAKPNWAERLKLVLITVPPHGRWETAANKTFSANKRARLAYNRDCRENYQSRGYDALIDLAAYKPKGFESFEHAAIDAVSNGENSVYLKDGIHYSKSGGQEISDNIFLPFYLSLKQSLP